MLIIFIFLLFRSESAATEHMEHHNEESADAENIIDLDGIEKDIIDQTSNKLNGKYFKMWTYTHRRNMW